MSIFFGFFLALFIPLLFLIFIRQFDFYQSGQVDIIWKCLFWGGFAYAPAIFTNWTLGHFWLKNNETFIHFIAPIHEEIFKGLILFYLVRRAKFTYAIDGAIYGFAIGIGFAVVENIDYLMNDLPDVLIISVQRIFSANLIHASSSGLVGIALGTAILKRYQFHWLFFSGGVIMAISQHIFFNMISHNETRSLLIAILTGILSVGVIIIAMKYSQKQAQDWIKEKLGVDDRVTQGEVTLVDRLTSSSDILFPVVERFGAETASKVEQLLYLQARLGIKRKSLDHVQNNGGMRNSIETEIQDMQTEMENVRHSIGTYKMMFIRGLFTKEMVSVWEQLQAKIRERSAADGFQKGGGVWSSLEERLKS